MVLVKQDSLSEACYWEGEIYAPDVNGTNDPPKDLLEALEKRTQQDAKKAGGGVVHVNPKVIGTAMLWEGTIYAPVQGATEDVPAALKVHLRRTAGDTNDGSGFVHEYQAPDLVREDVLNETPRDESLRSSMLFTQPLPSDATQQNEVVAK